MAGVGTHRHERPSHTLDPPGSTRQIQAGRTPTPVQQRHLYARRATRARLEFLNTEIPRFEACEAWERSHNPRFYSPMFLVPKPGSHNQWRLIIDLRDFNRYCFEFN
jgi:hypothetical protein